MKADELRKKHQKLSLTKIGHSYQNDDLLFDCEFKLDDHLTFHPKVTIHNLPNHLYQQLSPETLRNFSFHLALAEVFSYWKAAVPKEIVIEVADLTPDQITFWHDLLIKGMGEFFYVNQIDFRSPDFVEIKSVPQRKKIDKQVKSSNSSLQGSLLPLGGGKDSIVSLELLKKHYQGEIILFALNPTPSVKETIALNQDLAAIYATREIDPTLIELNHQGYLNGHTPFSSYLAFLSTVVATIFDIKYVVISNERSSNEESVRYLDHPINHQYSKSFELEENFRKYVQANLPQPQAEYFSLMRPLYELQIARIFSQYPKYFSIFKSCNRGQRQNVWCGECSKCLFAFIILYPFLNQEEMTDIFGVNLLNNSDLWSIAKELIGYSHQKPLDCVGTHEESLVAMYLCYQKDQQYNKTLSKLSKMFVDEVLPREENLDQRVEKILTSWNQNHALPKEFARIVEYVHQDTFLAGK